MILKLLIFVVAITVVSAGQFNLEKLPLKSSSLVSTKKVFEKSLNNREECVVNGFKCLSCSESQYCFKPPGQDWIVEEIECSNDETCSSETGQCTSAPNDECAIASPYQAICYQLGLFPHPYDCYKYYLCSVDEEGNVIPTPKEFVCNEGLVYDSVSTLCIKQKKSCGPLIEQSCTSLGNSGPIVNNPSMFYTCLFVTLDGERHLIPQLFNCIDGEMFINDECRDPTPPGPELDADGKCTKTANYYYPNDCESFLNCGVGREPYVEFCLQGDYFDGWKQSCTNYNCNNIA